MTKPKHKISKEHEKPKKLSKEVTRVLAKIIIKDKSLFKSFILSF